MANRADWRSFIRSKAPTREDIRGYWQTARERLREGDLVPQPVPIEAEPTGNYYTREEIFEEVKKFIDARKKGEADIGDFVNLAGRVSPNDKTYAQMAIDVVDAYSRGKGNIADFVRLAEATQETVMPPRPDIPMPPEGGNVLGGAVMPDRPDIPMPPEGGNILTDVPPPPPPSPTREAKWAKYPIGRGLGSYPRAPQPSIPTPKPEYETPGRPRGRGSFLNPFAWKKARNRLWWK